MPDAKNPYSLTFGKEPSQLIERISQSRQVIQSFCDENPTQQVFMVTGPRGVGKTVFMTEVARTISKRPGWISVELNPEKNLLEGLAAKLSSENELARIFKNAQIDLSFFGLGLKVRGSSPINDIETALQKMILSLKKKGRRILITIDEVTNTPQMREFAAAFQILLRQDLPVCLLMTGLYKNINSLQNEKSLTFLFRAPKIALGPLNIGTIAEDYQEVLQISEAEALSMAQTTKGYSFAFQVLGYFSWENRDDADRAQRLSRQYLDDYAYDKIWAELSRGDKRTLYGIVQVKNGHIGSIREVLGVSTNQFNPYRQRLIRQGIISGEDRGYVRVLLPFFDKYVLAHYDGA